MARARSLLLLATLALLLAPPSVGRAGQPTGGLEVQSRPPGARVLLDGQELGATPLALANVPLGTHHVVLELGGYARWEAEVEVGAEQPAGVTAELEPLPAELHFLPAGPSAWITVDGVAYGLEPLVVMVPPGPHRVRLDRTDAQPWSGVVEVGPGEARLVQVELLPVPQRIPPPVEEPWPLAVMVENSPAARPQSGLASADIVYEALAEGGISRFMAVYLTNDPEEVGPVRSTRHYFTFLAGEFNAALVHVGSSPLGFAALDALGIRRIDHARGDPGFWRSRARLAPHNAYVNLRAARAALDARDPGGPGGWSGFWFKAPEDRYSGPPAPELTVTYPWGGYEVRYVYEPETNRYLRFMAGALHRDAATGEPLWAANVLVQYVPAEVIDREGRLDLEQVGDGAVLSFLDGTVLEGRWSKADYGSATLYWDPAGNRLRFNPGPIWVQLVPLDAQVAY